MVECKATYRTAGPGMSGSKDQRAKRECQESKRSGDEVNIERGSAGSIVRSGRVSGVISVLAEQLGSRAGVALL